MLRIIFSIVTAAAPSAIGFIYAARLEMRKKVLLSFKEAILILEGEICFNLNPPLKAFIEVGKLCHTEAGRFFEGLHTKMCHASVGVYEAFVLQMKEDEGALCLNAADREILEQFFAKIGKSDIDGERKNINNTCVRIDGQTDEADCIYKSEGKMWRGCGVLCGILAAVLLF